MSWSSEAVGAGAPPGAAATTASGAGAFDFPELDGVPAAALVRGRAGWDVDAGAAEASRADAERLAAERAAELEAARTEGRAEGEAVARAELRTAAEALAAAAAELEAERERALATVELAAAELALALADKVLGAALGVRPELVVDVVRGALRRLAEQQEATVLVNPDDLAVVREALDGLAGELGAPLNVRAERRVPRGGCRLRTADGEVDARIDEQLARAREIVTEALAP